MCKPRKKEIQTLVNDFFEHIPTRYQAELVWQMENNPNISRDFIIRLIQFNCSNEKLQSLLELCKCGVCNSFLVEMAGPYTTMEDIERKKEYWQAYNCNSPKYIGTIIVPEKEKPQRFLCSKVLDFMKK